MAIEERDPHTGYLTTGHEWNGIKELNTPVPRAIYFFLIVTALFAFGYWLLMPAWPLGWTYTKGLLGIDQRAIVSRSLEQAKRDRAQWAERIAREDFAVLQGDPAVMRIVRESGRTLFGDNCAACHGRSASGGPGFPNLTTTSWLWGGAPEAIAETIRVGINSSHPQTRASQMPAFGRDGVLQRRDIENVVAFLGSLAQNSGASAETIAAGKSVFAANCASCHGADAKGNAELGAPDLTDASWIYGGSAGAIYASVFGGRQGHMPSWEARLSPLERKILTLYLLDLRRAKP
jgi:cytochrome c oxidase cbb3-type subunit 3